MIRTRFLSAALVATTAVAAAMPALTGPYPAGAQPAPDPHVVKIASCTVAKPRPFSHHPTGTDIAYTNEGPVVLHGVTFTVEYRTPDATLTRTFEDAGTFAPNEPVKHHFPAFTDVTYAGPTPARCAVTAVR